MDGFEVLIYISLGVTILFVITSMFLKRIKHDKYIIILFFALLLLSIGIIGISMFVGGWAGMGYGILGLCLLIGTIIGGLIISVIKYLGKT